LYLLLAVAAIGHLASIPFAPPIDAGLRVYAATTPILALLIAVAVGSLTHLAMRAIPARSRPMAQSDPYRSLWAGTSVAFAVLLVMLAFMGTLVIRVMSHAPRVVESPCPSGEQAVYVRFSPGSSLRVVDSPQRRHHDWAVVPEIRPQDLRKTAGIVE